MNKAKLVLRRLRKYRSDRALRWVFPSLNHYTVITWRRVNPRYAMTSGVGRGVDQKFSDINCWNLASVTFCRTHIGAIGVQLLMGREQWTDGFRQQIVIIKSPGSEYLIPPTGVWFSDCPAPWPDPDLIPSPGEPDSTFDTLELKPGDKFARPDND